MKGLKLQILGQVGLWLLGGAINYAINGDVLIGSLVGTFLGLYFVLIIKPYLG